MKQRTKLFTLLVAATGMLMLILDSKTALASATEGLDLCIHAIIPSLFPFFVLSSMLTGALSGSAGKLLSPIGKLCFIPAGQESILLSGFLAGYPVGAHAVCQEYEKGRLGKSDARRMLGFCSNAGPAFIFGIAGKLFTRRFIALILWAIHIASAIFVGICLPKSENAPSKYPGHQQISISLIILQSVKALSSVCAWVILMRIVIGFFQRWILWILPHSVSTVIVGLLELTNGCYALFHIPSESLRFILCNAFLGFGGICILMQTISVTRPFGTGMYIPGKLLHCIFSVLLGILMQPILFPGEAFSKVTILFTAIISISLFVLSILLKRKKEVAFSDMFVYNK